MLWLSPTKNATPLHKVGDYINYCPMIGQLSQRSTHLGMKVCGPFVVK